MNDIGAETVMDPVVPLEAFSRLVKRYLGADGERRMGPIKEVERRLNDIDGPRFLLLRHP